MRLISASSPIKGSAGGRVGLSSSGQTPISGVGDHRHRKTEKEEDEELIHLARKSETLIRLNSRISLVFLLVYILKGLW